MAVSCRSPRAVDGRKPIQNAASAPQATIEETIRNANVRAMNWFLSIRGITHSASMNVTTFGRQSAPIVTTENQCTPHRTMAVRGVCKSFQWLL
ncbi:hypothetical protein DV706_05590 [Natronorubrum bangense]|uniref:Uncharacterized protein n=1 Tax=Natronorubrum bangense TaxID=61858 RepID=A0A4D6HKC0_9EURY|nr:hypothetical protein DV706_05590 [Natronorubrum bangense]